MTVATVPKIEFVVNPFPEPATPVWDEICLEWQLTDADGFRYWGETPSACERQYQGATHYLAANGQPDYHDPGCRRAGLRRDHRCNLAQG